MVPACLVVRAGVLACLCLAVCAESWGLGGAGVGGAVGRVTGRVAGTNVQCSLSKEAFLAAYVLLS